MYIVNFDKGTIPTDNNNCDVSLSEEHASSKGGMSILVAPSGPGWWFGECPPMKAVWDGYQFLRFDAFNPSDKPITMVLLIKPKPNEYEKRIDWEITLKPGQGSYEMDMYKVKTNNKGHFIWKNEISQWAWCSGEFTKSGLKFYVSNLRLESEDEGKKK